MEHSEYAKQALENIFTVLDQIQLGKVIILTGENGTGKSLIRKVVGSHINNNIEHVTVATVSLDNRIGLNDGTDKVCFTRDLPHQCTSENSLHLLMSMLKTVKDRFIIIDEPEIGMSQNLQMTVGNWLTKKLPEILRNNKGVLIITHSKEIVRQLGKIEHVFINIQGKDEETWICENPTLIDLDEYEKRNNELFHILQEHLK